MWNCPRKNIKQTKMVEEFELWPDKQKGAENKLVHLMLDDCSIHFINVMNTD